MKYECQNTLSQLISAKFRIQCNHIESKEIKQSNQPKKKNLRKTNIEKSLCSYLHTYFIKWQFPTLFFVFVLHFITFVVMYRIWFCIFIYFNNFNSLFVKMEFNLINWQFKSLLLLMTWKIIILENEWMNPWICNMLHQRKNKIDFQ